ncbi:TPA: hypothetical protein U2M30_003203 [Providencia stuartii]|uniref:hypothetical protein n=2 Tax=Providencia stuartii TaxID=588 RepID=UPI0012396430|nr:hypothetical protein FOB53_18000 [Providencia stuartii]HEM8144979.1 hypothetical protein [Providencia stuartii]HEM8875515.1 hypothetical protein [Providencia stuartii]
MMDKSRQQFEEWRSKNKSSTINLFDVWQASRESLEVELPTKEPNPSQNNSYAFGYNRAITEATELLNRQGVKIKNE